MSTSDEIMGAVEVLTQRVTELLALAQIRPRSAYELPEHLPPACRAPRKMGTSLKEVVARSLDRQAKLTGRDKNELVEEALLRSLPPDAIEWAINDMLADARKMWALTDPGAQLIASGE
jgi:hypothetical protein